MLLLFPNLLRGVPSSLIKFSVVRSPYSKPFPRHYIWECFWENVVNSLTEKDTVDIEIEEKVSVIESVFLAISSFFKRQRYDRYVVSTSSN